MEVVSELHRRNDAKNVNVITTACFSKVTKILAAALTFFLKKDEQEEHKSNSMLVQYAPEKTESKHKKRLKGDESASEKGKNRDI